jgi:hypothetical protein
LVAETRTEQSGRYSIAGLAGGQYDLGAALPGSRYEQVTISVGEANVSAPTLALGPDDHLGRWSRIGDTSPEYLGATDSGTLMADGRIIYCHDTEDAVIFDPASRRKWQATSSRNAQGCHATTVLLDGRVMFIGGQFPADPGSFRNGVRTVKAYNPQTDSWERLPDMNMPRWYPTATRLPDGRILVTGGGMPPNAMRTDSAEIYDPVANTWTPTGSMLSPAEFGPSVLLLTGEVLRTWYPPQLYNLTAARWRPTGQFVQPHRGYPGHAPHSLVLLPDGRAAAVGMVRSDYENPSMVELYDPATETWSLGSSPATLRGWPEVILLPDGKVLAAGGRKEIQSHAGETNEWGYVALADLYDPLADSWRAVATMRVQREYHALTILAPDGRVIVTAGTGAPAQDGAGTDNGIDAFEPPYLFRGPRPVIEAVSATPFRRGQTFGLTFSGTTAPTAVVLMGLNAVTHYVDGGASRHVSLPFRQDGNRLEVEVPADPVLVPAAHYIMFLMVDDIPSEGRIVRVEPAAVEPETPTPVMATDTPPSLAPSGTDLYLPLGRRG